jgi:hypothetical protein
LFDEFSEPHSFVEFAHQDQAAVGSEAGTLEIDLERRAEGELRGLVLVLAYWVCTPKVSSLRLEMYEY